VNRPLLVSSGEPAGIGPDICLSLAGLDTPVVVMADPDVLLDRARQLSLSIDLIEYDPQKNQPIKKNQLYIVPIECQHAVTPGQLDEKNVSYVLTMLTQAAAKCLAKEFSGLVTAPVHKAIINKAGYAFSGHTEFLAQQCGCNTIVMMLASEEMKVALVTTHIPLAKVPQSISMNLVNNVIETLYSCLKTDFALSSPKIAVSGLNPHAGESGYLGSEELEIIGPAIDNLKHKGMQIEGPLSADTMFLQGGFDAFVVMYHDQGLPVLKYSSFSQAVNVTLGLPIIRTSVDHGTALDLAGTGRADCSSLLAAINMAAEMSMNRGNL